MMLLVVSCICIVGTKLAVNANTVQNRPINFAAEVRRIVHQNEWAAVGPNSTINSKHWTTKLVMTSATEDTGELFLYLPSNTLLQGTKDDKRIDLIFNDNKSSFGVMVSGHMKKLDEGSSDYTRGLEAYRSRELSFDAIPSARQLYAVNILDIHLLRASEDRRAVSREEYFAGTDSA